ncbi:MAG TPA: helix-turn-helix domain-containing protein [Gaiellaceae bacterium]
MSKTKEVRAPKLRPFSERNGKGMTIREVADELGVTEKMVRRLLASGQLKKMKVGRLVRVHVDDLAAYIAKARGEGGR